MINKKIIVTAVSIALIAQNVIAAPTSIQSNETPDILVGGLAIKTGTHTGSVLNGSSIVYAKNARSYNGGLCTFEVNFSIYNDSPIKPEAFVTTMDYNNQPAVINTYTYLPTTNIKNYKWLVHLRPGNNIIKVHADQQNTVHENNEKNNRLTKKIRVIGQCNPEKKKLSATQQQKGTAPTQAQQGCAYDPDSAKLPCLERKRMKLINPFES